MQTLTFQGKKDTYLYYFNDEDSITDDTIINIGKQTVIKKGRALSAQKDVAIKLLYRQLSGNDKVVERSKREAQINVKHPNLLKMYEFVYDSQLDVNYVVSEYVTGKNLNDFMTNNPNGLDIEFSFMVIYQLMNAVEKLHESGYIHRGIEPNNIMITDNEQKLKLLDFGLIKLLNHEVQEFTTPDEFNKFAYYIAPEVIKQDYNKKDKSSDTYSIAVVLYELLTGKNPFENDNPNTIVKDKESYIFKSNNLLDSKVSHILEKALSPNPKDRYHSVNDFRIALKSSYFLEERIFEEENDEVVENIKFFGTTIEITKKTKSYFVYAFFLTIFALVFSIWAIKNNIQKTRARKIENIQVLTNEANKFYLKRLYNNSLELYQKANDIIEFDSLTSKIAGIKNLVEGRKAYKAGKYKEAFNYFIIGGQNNNNESYYYLAKCYYLGLGCSMDKNKAVEYVNKANTNGFAMASIYLDNPKQVFFSNEETYLLAKNNLESLSDNFEESEAMTMLAILEYFHGCKSRDIKKRPFSLLYASKNSGHLYSKSIYGLYLLKQGDKTGMKEINDAANQGDAIADILLASFILNHSIVGYKLKGSFEDAKAHLQKAADSGIPIAQTILANLNTNNQVAINDLLQFQKSLILK
jgi:serine/threonine protein kinase